MILKRREQTHDIRDVLLVEEVLVLLQTDGAAEGDIIAVNLRRERRNNITAYEISSPCGV